MEAKYTTLSGMRHFLPNNPSWRVYSGVWSEGLEAVEAGEMTAAEAVDIVIDRMKAELGDEVIIR